MADAKTIDVDGVAATGTAGPVLAKLVVVAGPDEGKEAPLETLTEVGTDATCQLVLSDPAVSRRHASLSSVGGRILLKDLGSRNGVFLGGTRLHQAEIPLGSVLTLGHSAIAIQARWYVREVSPSRARRFGEVLGESIAMREVFAILERVAPTDVTVLIEGESGTGKELVARSIHQASARVGRPYVVFDCGSVPKELAESELFGHRRGSFSGAVADRAGAFQHADGGTLFLDEIGELPMELQPKLLRALESGEIKPIGDDSPRRVDVRVIAATNRDLHAESQRGNFRSDLLYRLAVVRLRLPPLRHRPEDIPALVAHLLAAHLKAGDHPDGENLARLMSYSWPGNVRELRNTLTRAVALARRPGEEGVSFAQLVFNLGPLVGAPGGIGLDYPGVASPMPYREAKAQLLESFDRAYVEALLERHPGNVTRAAGVAGLSRKHLYELLRRTSGGIDPALDEDES
jgi:DNA-binding NtrC family response regulator